MQVPTEGQQLLVHFFTPLAEGPGLEVKTTLKQTEAVPEYPFNLVVMEEKEAMETLMLMVLRQHRFLEAEQVAAEAVGIRQAPKEMGLVAAQELAHLQPQVLREEEEMAAQPLEMMAQQQRF